MPRLEHDGLEVLRALVAIRQYLKPLITKRILDDTEKVTSLVVSNSRRIFKFELDQILLCLKKEQDLLPEDYKSFLGDLHRLLQLLEGLIDEQVLRPATALDQDRENPRRCELLPLPKRSEDHAAVHDQQHDISGLPSITSSDAHVDGRSSMTEYPKLEALIKSASDKSTSSDLSTLLRLPETEEDCREVEQALTDFNAKNLTRSNTAVHQDVGDIDITNKIYHRSLTKSTSRHELEKATKSQKCLSSLLSALIDNISTSKCPDSHIAKLQIRDLEGSPEGDGVQHKIFVSCCLVPDKWQETTCKVVPQPPPSSSKLKDVRSICKAIRAALNDERTLEILIHASRILRGPQNAKLIKSPPVWPTVSLVRVLASDQDRFGPLDKVILALNLSRALLRMYSAEMQSKEWTAENIFFLFDPLKQTVYEAYNPYLAYSLLQVQRSENVEPARPRKFSILISFAKLLLEIALERTLGPFSRPRDIALLELVDGCEVTDNVVKGYVDAVTVCLEANKRKSDDDDEDEDEDEDNTVEDQPLDEESQCRAVIFTVVGYLDEARTNGFAGQKDPNHPRQLKVSKAVQSQSIPNNLNYLRPRSLEGPSLAVLPSNEAENLEVAFQIGNHNIHDLGFPKQLFDVRKIGFNSADDRIVRAEDFLTRAEECYTRNIESLSNDRRIRIAILDTGVDENNAFLRGVRRRRRSKDSPFKAIRSFVGGSTAADTFGHGTNVAALVLRLAPETDLYIAKISRGQEEEGADPVVKAIEWAMGFNVHIISMSFAFPDNQPAIKKAIENAENDGSVFFAAASNYGGNTSRLFPAKLDKVLCIHASDGHGNKSGMDPSPKMYSENISTLGVAIPSIWKDGVYLSGTSYSTPVAAGIAANVLRFVQHVADAGMLTQEQRNEAFSRTGIKNIMLAMSEPRDQYQYVTPWRRMWNKDAMIPDVVTKIKEALKE